MYQKHKNKGYFIRSLLILLLTATLYNCAPKAAKPTLPIDGAPIISHEITPYEVKDKLDKGEEFILLDVRQPEEYAQGHLEGAMLIPLDQLDKRYSELDKSEDIIVYCRSGRRSGIAAKMLIKNGFNDVRNMIGGIMDWPYNTVK